MSVCRRLAFFCRGDMEQMDRIFRDSELMRDKWDRPLSGSTYGQVTMLNAIRSCTSFYEPNYTPSAAEDFEDEETAPDEEVGTADAGDDGQEDEAQRLDSWLARDLTMEEIISPEFMELAMWAYRNDLAKYMAVKDKIPKKLGVRRFEQEMKKHYYASRKEDAPKVDMLSLTGCNTKGMIVPERWIVNDRACPHQRGAGLRQCQGCQRRQRLGETGGHIPSQWKVQNPGRAKVGASQQDSDHQVRRLRPAGRLFQRGSNDEVPG